MSQIKTPKLKERDVLIEELCQLAQDKPSRVVVAMLAGLYAATERAKSKGDLETRILFLLQEITNTVNSRD